MFTPNKYLKIYYSIINKAKSRSHIVGNFETHHIIPKSIGGSNKKDNLVNLTPKEHFICHKILIKITEGEHKKKMSFALWRMCNGKHDVFKTSFRYNFARNSFIESRKFHKHTPETKEKISKAHKGKPKPNSVLPAIAREINGRTAIWEVTTPTGEKLILDGISQFCKDNNISQGNLSTHGKSKGFFARRIGEYSDIKNHRLNPSNFSI